MPEGKGYAGFTDAEVKKGYRVLQDRTTMEEVMKDRFENLPEADDFSNGGFAGRPKGEDR